jgi:hypothetical protein
MPSNGSAYHCLCPGSFIVGTTIANERSHVETGSGILCLSNDVMFLRWVHQGPPRNQCLRFLRKFPIGLALRSSQKSTSCPRRLGKVLRVCELGLEKLRVCGHNPLSAFEQLRRPRVAPGELSPTSIDHNPSRSIRWRSFHREPQQEYRRVRPLADRATD